MKTEIWQQAMRQAKVIPLMLTKEAKRSHIVALCETLKKAMVL